MNNCQKIKAIASLALVLAVQAIYGNYDSDEYFHTPQPHPPIHGYNNVYPYYENPPFTYYYNYPYGGYYNKKFHDQRSPAEFYNYKLHKQMSDEHDRYIHGYQHYDDNFD